MRRLGTVEPPPGTRGKGESLAYSTPRVLGLSELDIRVKQLTKGTS